MNNCDCIIAFHIGHSEIQQSEVKKDMIIDTCCGGVILLTFCPKCGNIIKDKAKFEKWQKLTRKKEVKERIKNLTEEDDKSDFMKSVLESYKKELKELNDAILGADE